ncbi:MAG TPA: ChbG/HpnK family deacetylase [Thermoanaerobaculia bacterium]|nr:ChbG/HpnK family deacetylase [Thermoanaerobaculia bacterium]
MKRLWINADDFGLTPAVTAGICEAVLRGAVTTTTAMVCGDDGGVSIARFAPELPGRIGLHLQLTDGVPRCAPEEVPSLVGPDGRFPRKRLGVGRLDPGEVEREWEAQLAALRALGVEPSHLDSHHHIHQLPAAFEVYMELARRHGLPARGGNPRHTQALRARGVVTADVFTSGFYQEPLDVARFVAVAAEAAGQAPDGGLVELMCHPGRVDDVLRRRSSYAGERELELAVLCAPELPERLRERGIGLARPDELRAR